MRVFLDANILFSAAHSPIGASAYIFEIAKDFKLSLITCHYAVEEAHRNLKQKSAASVARFRNQLSLVDVIVTTMNKNYPTQLPEKDAPIYCSALIADAQYLVTLDKKDFGFLFFKMKQPFVTCLPSTFLAKLREEIKK
jgi:predicted nucleic acid-binding protein